MAVNNHFSNIVLWCGKSSNFELVNKIICFKFASKLGGFGEHELNFIFINEKRREKYIYNHNRLFISV
ncbi:hypothetical protein C1634_024830 [Chryseobacterium viscerum]|uniref:Uncharacterized protein n=1 Tax=Chryseobacterium viscerum TaxID=1037377 RepID=A0A316WA11_9FLAO|nr:hypothetical protein C1634_024830 [Chryseobacterium viscerum]